MGFKRGASVRESLKVGRFRKEGVVERHKELADFINAGMHREYKLFTSHMYHPARETTKHILQMVDVPRKYEILLDTTYKKSDAHGVIRVRYFEDSVLVHNSTFKYMLYCSDETVARDVCAEIKKSVPDA